MIFSPKEVKALKKFFKENDLIVVDGTEAIITGRNGKIALNEIDWNWLEEELETD